MGAHTSRRHSRSRGPGDRSRRPDRPWREDLERELERLRRENEKLREKIDELERQLAERKRNSTNSSKPPSSDGLAGDARPRGRKHKSRRKPGGQPGHPGHHRNLVPPDRVDKTVVVLPDKCGHCGRSLPQVPE